MNDLQRAKEYQKKHQVLTLIGLVLTPLILLIVLISPLSILFRDTAFTISENPYAACAVYFLMFTLFSFVIELPFSFYSSYTVEHQFNLSTQTLSAWALDFLKKTSLSMVFFLVLLEGLYALIWNFPTRWWILAWAGYALISFGVGKVFPVVIIPLFYKYGKVEQESLRQKIVTLAAKYKMPLENVYTINLSKTTKKANAAFMGMGKTKRVVLSDTLIENFTEIEIETVVAHELGHFIHKDIWKQLGFGLLTSLALFRLTFQIVPASAEFLGFQGAGDLASLPILFIVFYVGGLLLMPIQNGFSRILERAADRFALQACPDKETFISCMDKLGKVNLADPDPHPVYEWFFYDHPAIGKRIQMARDFPSFS